MKHLIVLPGNSARNKEWGERILSHYAEYFDTLYLQEYAHWETGSDMDMVAEEGELRAHVETLEKDKQVFVLAKSAGSILCIGAVQAGFLRPVYAAFFGLPLEWAITDVFGGNWQALEEYDIPTIAFHNTNDPVATYAYTKGVIDTRMSKVSLITTEGSDHNYNEVEVYDKYLLPMFQK